MAPNRDKMTCDLCNHKVPDPSKSRLVKKGLVRKQDGGVVCESCYLIENPKVKKKPKI